MPQYIVRQPDGNLAAFSTVSEDFTAWHMTADEAKEYCRDYLDLGPVASEKKVTAGVEDHILGYVGRKGDGSSRWIESLEMMALNKTRAAMAAKLNEMGFGDTDLTRFEFPSEDNALEP